MHADAYFAIGRTHLVCEDYAVAGESPAGHAYAIVADGCSGSPDTDVGARLLAKSLERGLRLAPGAAAQAAAAHAAHLALGAGLAPSAIDATLLYAVARDGVVQVTLHGDGVVAMRRRDGAVELCNVEFAHGAPAYPSYTLEPARRAAYLEATDDARRTVTWHGAGHEPLAVDRDGLGGERFTFDAGRYEVVAVMSDGIASFERAAGPGRLAGRVPAQDAVAALLALKSPAGRFVTRRCRRFLGRECAARGWSHGDDLAMAAIWLGDTR